MNLPVNALKQPSRVFSVQLDETGKLSYIS